MADPHHIEVLDGFDRLTVRLYRAGLTTTSLGIASSGVLVAMAVDPRPAFALVWLGVQLAVTNIHLYDSRFKWLFGTLAHLGSAGMLLGLATGNDVVFDAGLGFLFATLSGIGLKERLCFRIPGMKVMPAVLAASLVPLVFGWPWPTATLLFAGGGLAGSLAFVKLGQPLHFDIGDKSQYRV
jgi:uncharacterized integral membrane protein